MVRALGLALAWGPEPACSSIQPSGHQTINPSRTAAEWSHLAHNHLTKGNTTRLSE